jgi:hypothetical protein
VTSRPPVAPSEADTATIVEVSVISTAIIAMLVVMIVVAAIYRRARRNLLVAQMATSESFKTLSPQSDISIDIGAAILTPTPVPSTMCESEPDIEF